MQCSGKSRDCSTAMLAAIAAAAARYVCRSRVFVPFTGGGGEDDSSHFQFESIRSTIVNFSLSKILELPDLISIFLPALMCDIPLHCLVALHTVNFRNSML